MSDRTMSVLAIVFCVAAIVIQIAVYFSGRR